MTNDGTQDPVPPSVLSDPLAGLVTGTHYEPEPLRVRVTEPPMPDISAVRRAMAAVLDEDSEFSLGGIGPSTDVFPESPAGEVPAPRPAQPVAKVPVTQVVVDTDPPTTRAQVPTRGAVTRVSTTPAGIPAPRGAGTVPDRALPLGITSGEKSRRLRLPRGLIRDRANQQPGIKLQSSAGSVTLIVVLLLVMVVLGIVFLVSFIDTIAAVFD